MRLNRCIAALSMRFCNCSSNLRAFLLLGTICIAGNAVVAAPITFRFEAEIGTPSTGNPTNVPFDLPFELNEGDTILGTLTIEPFDAPPTVYSTLTFQTLNVSWVIDEFQFASSNFRVAVQDDLIVSDGIGGPYDELVIDCSPIAGTQATCSPNTLGPSSDVLWGFALGLAGPASTNSGADIPYNVQTWNAFDLGRGLSMSFRESDGPGFVFVNATVGAFAIVPEPSCAAFAVGGVLWYALGLRRRS
jgi:hypothetical protein